MSYVSEKPCECPVCFESLNNELKPLSCGHWTHKECIVKSKKECCPICRQSIELTVEERNMMHFLRVKELNTSISTYVQEYVDNDDNMEYDDVDEPEFLMPAEQYIVTFTAISPFRYEDEAILYDGRIISCTNTLSGIVVRCAFVDQFEAMNFSYDIEQRDDITTGSVVLRDITQSNSLIHSGSYNLIDF
jgi:hypothetical protein